MDPGKRTFYLGRYNCIEQLGTGPLGETYRAKIYGVAGFEKQFAVKRLHPELSGDEAFVARFVQAASAFAALEHPQIARVHEVNAQGAHYYIVTDLVRGLDLRRLLDLLQQRGEALAPDAAMTIAAEVAETLAYAHGRSTVRPGGVLHLGLTAPSLMITYEGRVTLLDVGLTSSLVRPGWSNDDKLCATLAYVAPELWPGDSVDPRADVFSLGVVLHELLSGARVFISDRAVELRRAIEAGPPAPPPGDLRLQQIVTRSLQPDPEKRFATLNEMGAAIRAILGGRAERARADLAALVRRLALPRERRTGAFSTVGLAAADGSMSTMAAKPPPIPATPRAWAPPVPKPPTGGVLSAVPAHNTLAGIGPDDQALVPIELVELPGTPTEKAMPTVLPPDEAETNRIQRSDAKEFPGAATQPPSSPASPLAPSAVEAASTANGQESTAAMPPTVESSWSPPPLTPSPPSPILPFASPKPEEPPPPIEPARSAVPGMKLPPRRGGARAVWGSVFVLAAAGLLAVYAGLGGNTRSVESPSSASRASSAAAAVVVVDAAIHPGDMARLAASTLDPGREPVEPGARPVAAAPTSLSGAGVEISTTPAGAALFIDGAPHGTTPTRVAVAAGTHKLIAAAEGQKLLERQVELTVGQKLELTLEPAKLPPSIAGSAGLKVRCKTHGELRVFVDGADSGRSCPNEERISVTAGPHKIGLYSPRTNEMHELEHEVAEGEYSTRVYVRY